MNYDDYYARQVGGALPYFTGARVQKGHGFGSLFSGLLRSVAPLIKRGALALGQACANHRCADSRRRCGWSEYQEGNKTKSDSSWKSPDEQSSRHTPTSGQTHKTNCTADDAYKTNCTPSSNQSYQTTTTTTRRILLGWRSYTDNRARG